MLTVISDRSKGRLEFRQGFFFFAHLVFKKITRTLNLKFDYDRKQCEIYFTLMLSTSVRSDRLA